MQPAIERDGRVLREPVQTQLRESNESQHRSRRVGSTAEGFYALQQVSSTFRIKAEIASNMPQVAGAVAAGTR
jgi:hypothetical protein